MKSVLKLCHHAEVPTPGSYRPEKIRIDVLTGISKRGNPYLRRLFVQGAHAVLQQKAKQSSGLCAWLAQLTTRTHSNVAAVALANKLARMAWAVLAKNEPYRPPMLVGAATA